MMTRSPAMNSSLNFAGVVGLVSTEFTLGLVDTPAVVSLASYSIGAEGRERARSPAAAPPAVRRIGVWARLPLVGRCRQLRVPMASTQSTHGEYSEYPW